MTTRILFNGGSQYLVATRTEQTPTGPLELGRLVDVQAGTVSGERPLASFVAMMPYDDFQPFAGDPAPILARLEAGA